MSETEENVTFSFSNHKGIHIAYILRFVTGVVMIIISSVAAGCYSNDITEKYGSVFPYFVGGFVTGMTMTLSYFVNRHFWVDVYRGRAITAKQKTQWVRSGSIISVISTIFAVISSVVTGIHGVQTPYDCRRYVPYPSSRTCTESEYRQTSTYKTAVALLVVTVFSILVNIIYMWQPDPFDDSNKSGNRRAGSHPQQSETLLLANTNRQVPASGNSSSGFVESTRHRQPEAVTGATLYTQGNQGAVNNGSSPNAVLDTHHSEPEQRAGAILSSSYQGQNRGLSESVLNSGHGRAEPFGVVVLSTDTQQSVSLNNLVLELQEQNRLLREQLAIQHQQQQQQQQQPELTSGTLAPSAPLSESPPSYESLMSSH